MKSFTFTSRNYGDIQKTGRLKNNNKNQKENIVDKAQATRYGSQCRVSEQRRLW